MSKITVVGWLETNIQKYQQGAISRQRFFKDCSKETGVTLRTIQKVYKNRFRPYMNCFDEHIIEDNSETGASDDVEILESNVKLAKSKQKFADTNRIERKSFREYARIENAVSALGTNLSMLLSKYSLNDLTERHPVVTDELSTAGIVHVTDAHMNELVEIIGNTYDFNVASKRLRLLACRTKSVFKAMGIRNVLVAFTGDMINSDRRLDELLNQATNRAKALFLVIDILRQFILDLNEDFNITIASVSGNESRIPKDIGWSQEVLTDNYDFLIHNILGIIFKDTCGVKTINGSSGEQVVEVAGMNILLLHGLSVKANTEKQIAQIVGRYASKGINIAYVLFGHLHSSRIGDTYARGSSLVGANNYSDEGLNLISKASQNIFVIHENGNIDGMKICLQNVDDVVGYTYDDSLEAYNPKSATIGKTQQTIFKVVI